MLTTQNDEASLAVSYHFNLKGDDTPRLGTAESRRLRAALLDSISRDVARPLALITGAAESLKKRNGSSDGVVRRELIDVVESATERLERFVSALLDLAKLECDGIDLRSEPVTVKDVAGVAVKDAARTLRDRTADVSISTDLPTLRLDSAILRRVLFILIENAARQSPPGSTVSIHAGRDRKAVRLQILDEGEGIPPLELARLFDQLHLPCGDDQNRAAAGMHLAVQDVILDREVSRADTHGPRLRLLACLAQISSSAS
jgi:two-component system, OmpR family, sensor histidine kinase KdpD